MSATKRNRTRTVWIWIALVVIIAAVFGIRFRQLDRDEALVGIRSVQETEGIPVETVTVHRGELSRWITLAGTVEGEVQYPIVSQNALRVVAIPVDEGDRVEVGDVVVRLAAGAPSPMYHSLDRARATYEQALKDVKRMRNLYAEGAVSASDLDAAETALRVHESDLQDAEGSTALRAGQAGVVSRILVQEGETVSSGKALVWILDDAKVKLRFSAGSAQARALAVGQLVELVDGDPDDGDPDDGDPGDGRGEISRLDLMADPKTHLLDGEALLPNTDGRHLPGLLLSFRVRTHHRPEALTLPNECLVPVDGGGDDDDAAAAWIVTREGGAAEAHLVPVTTGVKGRDEVEIVSGLAADAEVVKFGQTLLSEGAPVRVIERGGEK